MLPSSFIKDRLIRDWFCLETAKADVSLIQSKNAVLTEDDVSNCIFNYIFCTLLSALHISNYCSIVNKSTFAKSFT